MTCEVPVTRSVAAVRRLRRGARRCVASIDRLTGTRRVIQVVQLQTVLPQRGIHALVTVVVQVTTG